MGHVEKTETTATLGAWSRFVWVFIGPVGAKRRDRRDR